jgi:hypothetical protein
MQHAKTSEDLAEEIELSEEVQAGVYDFLMERGFCAIRWDGIELLAMGSATVWEDGKYVATDDFQYYSADDFETNTSTYEAFESLTDLLCVELPTTPKGVYVFELNLEDGLH